MRRHTLLLSFFLLISNLVFAQKLIEGKITDNESGEPIPNATIVEKGTSHKPVTADANGNFQITVTQNKVVLVITATGYRKQEIETGLTRKLHIGLAEQATLGSATPIIIGSRDQSRDNDALPTAVDIIPVAEVVNQTGMVELNQILNYAAPSFNANRMTGEDLADHVDPSSLRGLGPDQVLVLVNGKRMRPSSIINIFGARGRGNAGTDLNTIPASAVERIEILRDGAAAQYGSDAVAGVINVVLKGNAAGTLASLHYGNYVTGYGNSLNYENVGKLLPSVRDGQNINAAVTHGFQFGKSFLSVTANYLSKGATHRPNNEEAFEDSNFRDLGGEAAYDSKSIYFNGSFPTAKGEFYALGGYNQRNTLSYIWNIPFDDTTRNVYEIHSEPYHPQIFTRLGNLTTTAGFKTKFGNWLADFSQTVGANTVDINTQNTLNPSLLTKSPTEFHNGDFRVLQNMTDMDFSRKFPKVLQGLNLAFGSEFRHENFKVSAGDEAAWKTYPNSPFRLFNPDGTTREVTKVGTSQGYPGFRPEQAVNANRYNIGFYTDAELNVSQALLLAGAVRYEHYSDFGSTFGGKLAVRYSFSPKFYVRGSFQTGFRAPSLSQVHFQSTVNDVDSEGNNFEKVIFNNRSQLTQKLGIPQLQAEKSVNANIGLVFKPSENVNFSIDAYSISVKDRIILTGTFKDNDDVIGNDLKALNVLAAQFFTNALDTRTTGLDITGSLKKEFGKSKLNLTVGANINRMEFVGLRTVDKLRGKEDIYLSPREVQFILSAAPDFKGFTTLDYKCGNFGVILRGTVFGGVDLIGTNGVLGFDADLDKLYYDGKKDQWLDEVQHSYAPRLVTDLILNYDLNKKFQVTIGGNNLFDVYPTTQTSATTDGGLMWDSVQMGQYGAYFFTKLTCKF